MRILLGLFLLLVALLVVASRFLPWYVVLLAAIVTPVLLGIAAKRLLTQGIENLFMKPFELKGAVLRGAGVVVHAVEPAGRPEGYRRAWEEDEDEDDPDDVVPAAEPVDHRLFYWLETTITPQAPTGERFTHWEPGELQLIRPDATTDDLKSGDEEVQIGEVVELQVMQDGAWQADEGYKFEGPQRLKLLVAVEPGTGTASFQYYFEKLGEFGFGPTVEALPA